MTKGDSLEGLLKRVQADDLAACDPEAFALLSEAREVYGVGWRSRIAEELGVDSSAVSRWCKGGTMPRPARLALRWLQAERERVAFATALHRFSAYLSAQHTREGGEG
jgi:transcriptional regulator with XRE-family HTH domain